MSASTKSRFDLSLIAALLFGTIVLGVLVSLGTWQVQRLAWKEDLLATIDQRINAQPIPLSELLTKVENGDDIEYIPVATSGYFDHNNEQHFFATFEGNSGYYVYTPLEIAADRFVIVNRGFVPFDRKDLETRPESLVVLQQDVIGLARSAPETKAGWLVPENDIEKNVFHWKDMSAMIARIGKPADQFLPIFIDQKRDGNSRQLPIGGVTLINLPNNHLQYAITWYGLALTLVGVLGFYVFRRLRGEPDVSSSA